MKTELSEFKKQVRQAFADYTRSEGCSCCRDIEGHEKNAARLGKMLNVKKFKGSSVYDFSKYYSR